MRMAAKALQAQMFLVEDVGKPGRTALWHAVLRGAMLVDVDYFLSGGSQGLSRRFAPAVAIVKRLWTSEAFAARFPVPSKLLRNIIAAKAANNKWRLLPDEAVFLAKLRDERNRSRFIGLYTAEEAAAMPALAAHKYLFSKPESFLEAVTRIDRRLSTMNCCGL